MSDKDYEETTMMRQQQAHVESTTTVDSIIDGIQNTIEERFERIEEITNELEQGEAIIINLNNNTPSTNLLLDLRRGIIDRQCIVNDLQEQIKDEVNYQTNLKIEKDRSCIEILKGKEQFLSLSNEIVHQMNILINHENKCFEVYNKVLERNLMADEELQSYEAELTHLQDEYKKEKTDPKKERTKKLIRAITTEVADKKKRLESLKNEFSFLAEN
jgi:hypothetical protein